MPKAQDGHPGGAFTGWPRAQTSAVFVEKPTRAPEPAVSEQLAARASWQTSPGLACPSVERKYQLHGPTKDVFQWSGRSSCSTTAGTAVPRDLLTLTGKAGACKAKAPIRKNQTPRPAWGWQRCLGRSPRMGRDLDAASGSARGMLRDPGRVPLCLWTAVSHL